MATQVPWIRVFVEGVVIVGSILLALAADAWWDQRQDRRAERDAVRGLYTDFANNLVALRGTVAGHEAFVHRLARLEGMSEMERRAVSGDSLRLFVEAMATPSTFAPRDGILDALLASGRLEIIEAPGLSDGLVQWKSLVTDSEEEAARLYDAAVEVNERILALGGPWTWSPSIVGATPRLSEARSRSATADLATIARDTALETLVQQKLWMTAIYLQEIRRMARHAESVLAMTDSYFDGDPVVVAVSVESEQMSAGSAFTAPPRAWADLSDGRRRRVDFDAAWSSSDTTIADALTARRPGQVDLCATYGGVQGCETFLVVP